MPREFASLLAPGHIGGLDIRNRILMSPMGSNLAEEDGSCGERILRYYEARARGGAGMVIMGSVGVAWPRGSGNARQVAISEDRFIEPLAKVAEAVHAQGAKIALQLQHAGAVAVNEPFRGFPFLVPSIPKAKDPDWAVDLTPREHKDMFEAIFAPGIKFEYKEADAADIEWLVGQFAKAAVRARAAGIDGVEIHAGHGYIVSSFLSPASNHRSDNYGGSIENRARLLCEIIRAIKAAVGSNFPVWFRFDSMEYLKPDGITVEDAVTTAQLAEAAGADAVHVSAYADASRGISFTEAHSVHQPAKYIPATIAIKRAVKIPVIGVGRIAPKLANRLVAEGSLDFVAMARALLAEPDLPNLLAAGRVDLARPCIYCYTCISQIFFGSHVRCAVNAQTGFEAETKITPATVPRRVLVVGGGPAGMEAARVCRLRGHHVELHEATERLGGTVFFSSVVYPENGRLIDYLKAQLRHVGVKVNLSSRIKREDVERISPDVVVVAAGARRPLSSIPGTHLDHVFSGDELREMVTGTGRTGVQRKLRWSTRFLLKMGRTSRLTRSASSLRRWSRYYLPLGRRVVIHGGGLVGVELAEFLLERGYSVTVLEAGPTFGSELMLVRRWRVMDTLRREGAVLLNHCELVEILSDAVVYRTKSGQLQKRGADTVIMASGVVPDGELSEKLRQSGIDVHCIGDSHEIGYIEGAIRSAHRIAREI